MEEKKPKELVTKPSKNLKVVMSLVDTLIAGKRFTESDTKTQIYLMTCQTKIREMQEGHFDETGIAFLYDIINSLSHKLAEARDELSDISEKLEDIDRIEEGLKEVELIKKGEIKPKTWDELKKELEENNDEFVQ